MFNKHMLFSILVIGLVMLVVTSIPPPNSAFSYGGAAAWGCSERAFAWLVYTAQDGSAPSLFDQALSRFTCGN